jgi:probable F420-dependent oxidoreductase
LASAANVLAIAQEVEQLGYSWVTCGEHIFMPKQMSTPHPATKGDYPIDASTNIHEAFTMFAWLAGQTTKLRFITAMTIIPYRSPFVTFKSLASVDYLSGGRLTLGASAGWLKDEFDALNVPFHSRGRLTDEYLSIIVGLMESDDGRTTKSFSYPDAHLAPRPVQRPFPIIVGGAAVDAVLSRVVRFGVGWWPWPLTVTTIAETVPRLKELWSAAERGLAGPDVYCYAKFNRDSEFGKTHSAQEALDTLASYAAAGVTHVTLNFGEIGGIYGSPTVGSVLDGARWFASEVAPDASAL